MPMGRGSGLGGAVGGGASVAEDMFFASIAERDTFTANNPDRIEQGVTCAVDNGASGYDYYQWSTGSSAWQAANLIFRGPQGLPGPQGVSVDSVSISGDDFVFGLDDGSSVTLTGVVPVLTGETGTGVNGASFSGNDIVFTLTDGSNLTLTDAVTTLTGPTGTAGASVNGASFSGSNIEFSLDDGSTVTLPNAVNILRGPTGATGAVGPQGPEGAVGPQGEQVNSVAFSGNDIVFTLTDGSTATLTNAVPQLTGPSGSVVTSAAFSGNDIVFDLDDGSSVTLTGAVPTLKGPQGEQVSSAAFSGDDIVFTLTDASTVTLTGAATTLKGPSGSVVTGASFVGNDIVFTLDDGSTVTLTDGVTILTGPQGDQGPQGLEGPTGANVDSVSISGDDIVFGLSDGSTATLTGGVTSLTGPQGPAGNSVASAAFSGDDIVFTLSDASTVTLTNAAVQLEGPQGPAGTTDHDALSGKALADQHPIGAVTGLQDALDAKVNAVAGKALSDENFTSDEKLKLAGLEGSKLKGLFASLSALETAHPTAEIGDYAFVDGGVGNPNELYVWDAGQWEKVSGDIATATPAQIKDLLLQNPDTNNFGDAELAIVQNAASQTDLTGGLAGKADTVHGHVIGNVSGLQDALNSKLNVSDKASNAQVDAETDDSAYLTVVKALRLINNQSGFSGLQTAILEDQKPSGTNGGGAAAGLQTRDLNTVVHDSGIVSLDGASNKFTLSNGTYLIEWDAPALNVDRHKALLYSDSAGAVKEGSAEISLVGSYVQTRSFGSEVVTVNTSENYRIVHYIQKTNTSTDSLGINASAGTPNVFTRVKITKL